MFCKSRAIQPTYALHPRQWFSRLQIYAMYAERCLILNSWAHTYDDYIIHLLAVKRGAFFPERSTLLVDFQRSPIKCEPSVDYFCVCAHDFCCVLLFMLPLLLYRMFRISRLCTHPHLHSHLSAKYESNVGYSLCDFELNHNMLNSPHPWIESMCNPHDYHLGVRFTVRSLSYNTQHLYGSFGNNNTLTIEIKENASSS